jgi:patatin-like phospholipase/acyl hydrolase
MRKILSIDGGGIRGIIPALVLARIEQQTGKPASELFDLIAGTSTGGILALGLVKPGPTGIPEYSADQLAELYERQGSTIFHRSGWRRILACNNLFDGKYPASGIESVLEEYFGDARLKSALTEVFVTSYEIERQFPFFFRSSRARATPSYDFPMKLAARATSAAPTYFEPLKMDTDGNAAYFALVDGGLFANNPALCALVEAREIFGPEECMVVSLGTGSLTRPLPVEKAKTWGLARWAKPVLNITLDGVSSSVDYQLHHLLPRTGSGRRYYRFQPTLHPENQEMDNTSRQNLRGLKLLAESMLRSREDDINELCELLVKPPRSEPVAA